MNQPECVSGSVLEVKPPEFILNEDIAGSEISVALLEDVGQNLLLRCFGVAITLK